ncbi:hypothetical protein [Candidatus Rickettsia kedanie]|uniref:Uncharacterized protein n=1 Tax=Candidatus Rickettsia kedanie TaxID=3115352 RepID=A0ABP9TXA8_9RICK
MGLYAIPDNYKSNPNVKHAAAKYQELINSDKLLVLGVRWNSMETTKDAFEVISSDEE